MRGSEKDCSGSCGNLVWVTLSIGGSARIFGILLFPSLGSCTWGLVVPLSIHRSEIADGRVPARWSNSSRGRDSSFYVGASFDSQLRLAGGALQENTGIKNL